MTKVSKETAEVRQKISRPRLARYFISTSVPELEHLDRKEEISVTAVSLRPPEGSIDTEPV